jgi:hypothetical protein
MVNDKRVTFSFAYHSECQLSNLASGQPLSYALENLNKHSLSHLLKADVGSINYPERYIWKLTARIVSLIILLWDKFKRLCW